MRKKFTTTIFKKIVPGRSQEWEALFRTSKNELKTNCLWNDSSRLFDSSEISVKTFRTFSESKPPEEVSTGRTRCTPKNNVLKARFLAIADLCGDVDILSFPNSMEKMQNDNKDPL